MKRIIFLLLGIMAVLNVQSQVIDLSEFGVRPSQTDPTDLRDVQGTPYLNENFLPGSVKAEGKEPLNVYMRYNVSEEVIEIKTDHNSEEIYIIPANQQLKYQIGSDNFVLESISLDGEDINGYFLELYSGDNVRLLSKPVVNRTDAVPASGYSSAKPAEIKIEQEYYIILNGNEVKNVELKRRNLRKAFDSREAKNYLSDNRIKSVEDMIGFVHFLDQSGTIE